MKHFLYNLSFVSVFFSFSSMLSRNRSCGLSCVTNNNCEVSQKLCPAFVLAVKELKVRSSDPFNCFLR